MLKLLGLIVPLGLDTFAVAAALGIAGAEREDRLRLSTLFTAFEMGMPLVGLFGGALGGRIAGGAAELLAILMLIALGVYMLWPRRERGEAGRRGLLERSRGMAAIGLGLSISLDELAIGFTLGLLGFPVLPAVLLIGLQAALVTQAGLRLGARLGERVREGAERLAGLVLVSLGLLLALQRLVPTG
ncbi:MAG TPA: manganese efflux pump [Candidatus Dormibacteraeota bacterium]